jgi:ribosomal protein S8
VREEKEPFSRLVSAPVATVKTAIYRVLKRSGYTLSIADFKDNYIAQLLKRGLPFDIVVEFSSSNLERVSYINRVIMLKSKADFIEESLKSGGVK